MSNPLQSKIQSNMANSAKTQQMNSENNKALNANLLVEAGKIIASMF